MIKEQKQFQQLKEQMERFLAERNWKEYHNPKNVAMSIAIEAAELMEVFQWHNQSAEEVMKDSDLMTKIKDEVADVMIYLVSMGLCLDIDLFQAAQEKMAKNEVRFPPLKGT